ncbi:Uncharacterised protein [Bordetella pertussis]|nr:Uncharacterised protein [Bordetella pertussis]
MNVSALLAIALQSFISHPPKEKTVFLQDG